LENIAALFVAVGTHETFADIDNTSRRKTSPTRELPIVSHCTVEPPMMLKAKERRARIRIPNSLIRYISLSKSHHKKSSLQSSSSSESPNRPGEDNEERITDDEFSEKSSSQSSSSSELPHQPREDDEEGITNDEKATALSQNTLLRSNNDDKKRNKVVSFGSVHIREYDITIGDNVPTQGIPIGLKWKYTEIGQTSLVIYESHRQPTRRTKAEMYLPPQVREDMLLETHHARSDVREGKQKADEVRRLRIASQKRIMLRNHPILIAMKSLAGSAGRKLRRLVAQHREV